MRYKLLLQIIYYNTILLSWIIGMLLQIFIIINNIYDIKVYYGQHQIIFYYMLLLIIFISNI
jgi:hypothetical protein